MKRDLEKYLIEWKSSSRRYPLLLRGARQVGKTYLIEQLGKHFDTFEMVNFESQPEAMACFETLKAQEIIQKLELLTKRPIRSGKTLLFLDEIQACPKAISALRYFKENMPDLHVVGAGSLLEFALIQGKFSFPVGRVQFVYLKPLSFKEFSSNLGADREEIECSTLENPLSETSHLAWIQRTKEYFLVGGMPAVVNEFSLTKSFLDTVRIQDLLLATYRADFNKYATEAEQKYLRLVFDSISRQIGKQFQYSEIDPHMRSRELKCSIEQLGWAGILHTVLATSASGVPLSAQTKRNKFKPLFLDIGLVQRSLRVDPEQAMFSDLVQLHSGALAEQFVGQEFLAYADFFREEQLFFWEREKKGSSAEVDYVIELGSHIIPVEVKAGAYGHLKSLSQFIQEKKSPFGIRISQRPLSFDGGILSIPLYMIDQIPKLCRRFLS